MRTYLGDSGMKIMATRKTNGTNPQTMARYCQVKKEPNTYLEEATKVIKYSIKKYAFWLEYLMFADDPLTQTRCRK